MSVLLAKDCCWDLQLVCIQSDFWLCHLVAMELVGFAAYLLCRVGSAQDLLFQFFCCLVVDEGLHVISNRSKAWATSVSVGLFWTLELLSAGLHIHGFGLHALHEW